MLNVTAVRYISGHRLWLRFNDDSQGEIDLCDHLDGEMFEPLKDPVFFARVKLDPEIRTVAWPNGADFAPEFLRDLLQSRTAA